ncbi:L,D-transpeptidase [Fischerella sp. JS2]|uniref:L,D-transpeptidase n=1 Tax=Fischerella sp. JS2 TaxID=2597771 RepID=UPI0028EF1CCE|nr:L,D-transpeptidase [Fischerella sp. JS2]
MSGNHKRSLRSTLASVVVITSASTLLNIITEAPTISTPYSQTEGKSTVNSINQPINLKIVLSQRQVILYRGKTKIKSYPIAVGRPGWETPTGNFQVLNMTKNPTWLHPFTGESIPGGSPKNPLGRYWIGFWTNGTNWIGFHGTPNPESVGKAVSHGCIRMYNNDVQELFEQVSVGTPVNVVQ